MGTSQIISALQMEVGHVANGSTPDTIMEKNTYAKKLSTVLEAHQSVENNINRNESLSQAGKVGALAKLGNETTAPALKWIRPEITRLQEKKQRYERQFYDVDSGIKDPVERTLTYTYLWNKLDLLDPSARIKKFLEAAEQDQVVVLSAMLEHVEGPMVNAEVRERGLIERAKRLTPNDVTNYEQTKLLLEFLVAFRDWIARWLALEVGVELAVLRTALGNEIVNALSGLPQRQDAA